MGLFCGSPKAGSTGDIESTSTLVGISKKSLIFAGNEFTNRLVDSANSVWKARELLPDPDGPHIVVIEFNGILVSTD